jgi:hypothetical protein
MAIGLSVNGLICYPDKVTAEQAADVVRNYLDDHPADRDEWKYRVVTLALTEAFPCNGGE